MNYETVDSGLSFETFWGCKQTEPTPESIARQELLDEFKVTGREDKIIDAFRDIAEAILTGNFNPVLDKLKDDINSILEASQYRLQYFDVILQQLFSDKKQEEIDGDDKDEAVQAYLTYEETFQNTLALLTLDAVTNFSIQNSLLNLLSELQITQFLPTTVLYTLSVIEISLIIQLFIREPLSQYLRRERVQEDIKDFLKSEY